MKKVEQKQNQIQKLKLCQHRFAKIGFHVSRQGKRQRYQCQNCGMTSYSNTA